MGTTQRMAAFITGAKYEDIPAPAVNLAKLCLLDAVGCAIYGTTRPLGRIITELDKTYIRFTDVDDLISTLHARMRAVEDVAVQRVVDTLLEAP